MALRTPEEFVQSLADLHLQIYLFGERIEDYVNHPLIRPSINCIAMTYELAAQPEYEDLMLATSHLTGKQDQPLLAHPPVDRGPLQEGQDAAPARPEDRLVLPALRRHGRHQRPVLGHLRDATRREAPSITQRFKKYVQYLQDNDLVADGAMTDPKGDRSLPPHQQADPDVYLHIVERRDDGIVVQRRQGPPDRRLQLARDHRHADGGHARGRRGLRRQLQLPGQRRGRLLHLRPPELRHAQVRGVRPRRRQHALRRPGSAHGVRERLRPLGPRLPVRRDRVLRRARGAVRRLPPPELRRLQGRRRRRADRRRRDGRRHERRRQGQPHQGQAHRDDPPQRDALLVRSGLLRTRASRCRPATTRSTCCWPTCASRT